MHWEEPLPGVACPQGFFRLDIGQTGQESRIAGGNQYEKIKEAVK